jgi:hypothetical protein
MVIIERRNQMKIPSDNPKLKEVEFGTIPIGTIFISSIGSRWMKTEEVKDCKGVICNVVALKKDLAGYMSNYRAEEAVWIRK